MTLGPKNALPEKIKKSLDPNVDLTYANPFTVEYFIKLP